MLKRKIVGVVLTIAFLLSFLAFATEAATHVDTSQTGSLQLNYRYDGTAFENQSVRIYQVATVSEYADFSLTGAFTSLPVEVNQIQTQEEWRQLASTLSAFVTADAITPDREAFTDANGTAVFNELPLGLYLVESIHIEQENGYCRFDSFMISIPNLNEADQWVYDVEANPKSVFEEFQYQPITYTVNKLWKDEGHGHLRPQSISLEIYCNGQLVETVTLSAENNWTYSWTTVDDGAVWQVVEINVPDGYTVTMEQRQAHFFVTNGYDDPVTPPPTGDISNVNIYLIIMCVAGIGLMVLGLTAVKGKKA